jgi:DNA repair protein SbcD/Mre11
MTIAHLSDTHLGFRAFGRITGDGLNQREVDVLQAFKACLEAIAERDPDLVVHAGDLFHLVRPSNLTIISAFHLISTLQARRKGKPFVLIAGNHDSPRTRDSGNILNLFKVIPGVHVEAGNAAGIDLPEVDAEVLCVPSNSLMSNEPVAYEPQTARAHKVLVMHGLAYQVLREHAHFNIEDTRPERWSYVALGDYHVHQALAANCCYAGATEFTSTDIWSEATQAKGWVWFDTADGKIEFVPSPSRTVIDLPAIHAEGLSGAEVSEQVAANARWADEQPIVRQRVFGLHPSVRAEIDRKVLREASERALHYYFDPRLATVSGEPSAMNKLRGLTLEDEWAKQVEVASLPAGVERVRVKELGLELLEEALDEADLVTA